jgi:NTP pyrophosphatase (non-canonical NTP hydrolase)
LKERFLKFSLASRCQKGMNHMNTMDKINKFRDDRDWRQFHNEKDLAISISLEAAELLELFQWKSPEEVRETSIERIKEELADVLIYSHMLASNLDLDIDEIIAAKLEKNNSKYPVDKSRGNKEKYTEL